jgi:hypothetical protein
VRPVTDAVLFLELPVMIAVRSTYSQSMQGDEEASR